MNSCVYIALFAVNAEGFPFCEDGTELALKPALSSTRGVANMATTKPIEIYFSPDPRNERLRG